ncbi:MAG: hydantoinase/oxoprolinase family protein [Deltaproteobacteria bacterium]|nr:hydantoinase/oxoprolinase family protein [Deltaproteobacteria bacterium]
MITIGVDTGGTFTDFIYQDGDRWKVHKVLSTPANPAEAVLKGLGHIAADRAKKIVHGSTVATNSILERKGARTVLITNKGFEDVIEIGRQNRRRLYDLAYRREPHIVPGDLRFGVAGRMLQDGQEIETFHEHGAEEVSKKIGEAKAESVAVCFLFSFVNPLHELKMREILGGLNIPVSLSHEILSEFREFERTSTTVLNAYVSPKMQKYISCLIDKLTEDDSLSIMQSNGGSISAHTAMSESVRTILSGPAGGAVGALEIGKSAGHDKLITFDMGGTSTDVSLIDGDLSLTVESEISGYPIKVPMIDIHTVGAGGGSIASIDIGGSLKVGPDSAGADPGPICYGKGDGITVTDANLYLNRLIPEYFLGGNMKLYTDRLEHFFIDMSEKAGLSPIELAEGILTVANTTMEKAIRVISVERGFDPREFVLFSFGGAGGLHGAFLAGLLNIPKVIIPRNPGILSAIGMLMADVIKDYSHTVMKKEHAVTRGELIALFSDLEEKGISELVVEGIDRNSISMERYLDMRYQGQSYEIIVPFAGDYIENFHDLHEKKYGYRNEDKGVEIVNIRLRSRGVPEKPEFMKFEIAGKELPQEAILARRGATFDHKELETVIIARDKLKNGNRFSGPCIVVEYSSTIVVPPFAKGTVDAYGNIMLDVKP